MRKARFRRAAKIHGCYKCRKLIRIGARYVNACSKEDGNFYHGNFCLKCASKNGMSRTARIQRDLDQLKKLGIDVNATKTS